VKLLLDTCAFLWIAGGGRPVPPRVAAAYQSTSNDVFLSAASAWEIAVKYASGKLLLPVAPQSLIPAERERLGVTWLAIDEESALHVGRLPALHRDPFDRMLVAQSIVHGMTIVTPDPSIARYATRILWE
jgi:PIN domain nuclease of toxin-antitoxin system